MFATSAAAFTFLPLRFALAQPYIARQDDADSLTDVPGLRVGHFTDSRRPTGCTVILTGDGAVGSVDARGSAPSTRETDLLQPTDFVEKVHAVLLSGGSAFGLDAATGVMRYLEERSIGIYVGVTLVPIMPAATIFDLGVGDGRIRLDVQADYLQERHPLLVRVIVGGGSRGKSRTPTHIIRCIREKRRKPRFRFLQHR